MRKQEYLKKAADANAELLEALKDADKAVTVVPEGATKEEEAKIKKAAAKVDALKSAAHESGVLLQKAQKAQGARITDAELVELATKLSGLSVPKAKK